MLTRVHFLGCTCTQTPKLACRMINELRTRNAASKSTTSAYASPGQNNHPAEISLLSKWGLQGLRAASAGQFGSWRTGFRVPASEGVMEHLTLMQEKHRNVVKLLQGHDFRSEASRPPSTAWESRILSTPPAPQHHLEDADCQQQSRHQMAGFYRNAIRLQRDAARSDLRTAARHGGYALAQQGREDAEEVHNTMQQTKWDKELQTAVGNCEEEEAQCTHSRWEEDEQARGAVLQIRSQVSMAGMPTNRRSRGLYTVYLYTKDMLSWAAVCYSSIEYNTCHVSGKAPFLKTWLRQKEREALMTNGREVH